MAFRKETQRCVVILGMEEQGLALLQCMAKTHRHVHFFVDDRKKKRFRERTRMGVKHRFDTLESLMAQLQQLQKGFQGKLAVFITSATLLTEVRLEARDLYQKYDVWSCPLRWIDLFGTKNLMYEYAQCHGVMTKKHILLKDYFPGSLQFPVVLKRNIEHLLSFKTHVAYNEDELDSFVKSIQGIDDVSDIIIQEMVDSSSTDLSFHGFASKGVILGGISFEEVRHHPTGISSYLEELNEDDSNMLKMNAEVLFKETDFTGFFQIDFKYLPSSKELFIMDVNTRPPGSHNAFHHKFSNWKEFYASITDTPIPLIPKRKRIYWINVVRDHLATHKDRLPGSTFRCAMKSYWDVFDWADPWPFCFSVIQIATQRIEQILFRKEYFKETD